MIELFPGIFLTAFQNPFLGNNEFTQGDKIDAQILFKRDLGLLMEFSSKYVMQVQENIFKDYFYNSPGFPDSKMSLQTAIWAAEQVKNKLNTLSYFIIFKKIRSSVF